MEILVGPHWAVEARVHGSTRGQLSIIGICLCLKFLGGPRGPQWAVEARLDSRAQGQLSVEILLKALGSQNPRVTGRGKC